jgi:hypothetical protein
MVQNERHKADTRRANAQLAVIGAAQEGCLALHFWAACRKLFHPAGAFRKENARYAAKGRHL